MKAIEHQFILPSIVPSNIDRSSLVGKASLVNAHINSKLQLADADLCFAVKASKGLPPNPLDWDDSLDGKWPAPSWYWNSDLGMPKSTRDLAGSSKVVFFLHTSGRFA